MSATPVPVGVVVRNLLLEKELRAIAEEFRRRSIDLLVLKGIPLALRLFGSIDSRSMVDNDLLVRKADAHEALRLLRDLGYESIDHRTLATQLDFDYQYRLWRLVPNVGAVYAELHWSAFPNDLFPVSESVLWEHREPFDLGLSKPILVFDPPMTLVHLAAHFALSDFAVASILKDVAAAWNRWYAGRDASPALALARAVGLEHVLDFALLAAADLRLLDGEPPPIHSRRATRLRRFLPTSDLTNERPDHDYARKAGLAMLADPSALPRWLWRIAFPPLETLAAIEARRPTQTLRVRYLLRPVALTARVLSVMVGKLVVDTSERFHRIAKRAARLRELELRDWALLAESFFMVATVRTALWLFPFGKVLAAVRRSVGRSAKQEVSREQVKRVTWGVSVASRFVVAASCLTQALAAKVMLHRRGIGSTLHMGVAKPEPAAFAGHAWLESDGDIVLGNEDLDHYTEVFVWDGETR